MTDVPITQSAAVRRLIHDLRETAAMREKHFSDIVDDDGNQYIDLVMEGGGVLGFALVGYTYLLEQMGIRFLRVGGTSAGSIVALLLASLGAPVESKSQRVLDLLVELDLYQVLDGDDDARDFIAAILDNAGKLTKLFKALQVQDNIKKDLGLVPGDAFYVWISSLLSGAGIDTTRELVRRMRSLPPGLRTRAGKSLTIDDADPYLAVITADISTQTKVEFPRMAGLYWHEPEAVDPALYVRASMSVPYFFVPFEVSDIPRGEKAWALWDDLAGYREDLPARCTFVDGGIMSNFPIDVFHDDTAEPTAPTFGAKLGADIRRQSVDSPHELLQAVFNTARHSLDYDFVLRNKDHRRLVTHINTGAHDWLNFRMTLEDKRDLFLRGARAAAEFLTRFDWHEYKALRRQLAGFSSAPEQAGSGEELL